MSRIKENLMYEISEAFDDITVELSEIKALVRDGATPEEIISALEKLEEALTC